MNRRDLLAATSATLVATLGGCQALGDGGGDGDGETTGEVTETTERTPVTVSRTETTAATTTERLPSIRVTYTVTGGYTPEPMARSLVVDPYGRLTKRLDCNTRDGRDQSTEETLSPGELRDFQQNVLAADPATLADAYECTGTCASDLPFEQIEFAIDGRRTRVRIESGAEVPDELDRVRRQLSSFHDRLPEMDCVAENGTPTGETVTLTAREVFGRDDDREPVERTLSVDADGTIRYRIDCGRDGSYEFEATETFTDAEHAQFERWVLSTDPLSLSADCEDCEDRYLELTVGVDGQSTTIRTDALDDVPDGGARLEDVVEPLKERFDPPEDICSS